MKADLVLTWLDGAARDGRPYHSPAEAAAAIRELIEERDALRAALAKARTQAILDAIAECESYSDRAREHAITLLDDAIGDKFRCRAEGAHDIRNRLRAALKQP